MTSTMALWPEPDHNTPYDFAVDPSNNLVANLRGNDIGSGGDTEAQVSDGTCNSAAVVIDFQQKNALPARQAAADGDQH